MDSIAEKIIAEDEEVASLVSSEPPKAEAENEYFLTLKSAREILKHKCKEIQQEAYQKAYAEKIASVTSDSAAVEVTADSTEKIAKKAADTAYAKALPTKGRPIADLLSRYIRFIRIKPEIEGHEAALCFYDPDQGIYRGDSELLKDLISIIYPDANKKNAEDVLYKIARIAPLRKIDTHYTAIGDQLYNAKTGKFEPFNPSRVVVRKIKTSYNPEAREPAIKGWTFTGWLDELFEGDEELKALSIQIIKACITGQSLEKIFWLYGEGGTGKGTLQQLIINLVGMENIATLKITELNKSRFTTSILVGKSVVIGDDVQKNAVIKDTSDLFSLTTGDILTIEGKGKDPCSLRLQMTVIQSSNGFPIMQGDKSAIDRRFRILPFTSNFKGRPNKAIKDDYINRPEVLEYVLKLAIENPTKDINPGKSKEELHDFQRENNHVLAFVEDFFTDSLQSTFLPNGFVWHVWGGYAEYNNIPNFKQPNALHREIRTHLPPGFKTGSRKIPAGQHLPNGFRPRDDTPHYANKDMREYRNGRETEEGRKKVGSERGYIRAK